MRYAKRQFWLGAPVGGKSTQINKEVLDAVAKRKNRDPRELYKLPPVDSEFLYLINWFFELKGAEPLRFSEIAAWAGLRGIKPSKRELSVLLELDTVFYTVQNEQNRNASS